MQVLSEVYALQIYSFCFFNKVFYGLILSHYWGSLSWAFIWHPIYFEFFLVWLMEAHTIPGPVLALGIFPLFLFNVFFSMGMDNFLTCTCWSVLAENLWGLPIDLPLWYFILWIPASVASQNPQFCLIFSGTVPSSSAAAWKL